MKTIKVYFERFCACIFYREPEQNKESVTAWDAEILPILKNSLSDQAIKEDETIAALTLSAFISAVNNYTKGSVLPTNYKYGGNYKRQAKHCFYNGSFYQIPGSEYSYFDDKVKIKDGIIIGQDWEYGHPSKHPVFFLSHAEEVEVCGSDFGKMFQNM